MEPKKWKKNRSRKNKEKLKCTSGNEAKNQNRLTSSTSEISSESETETIMADVEDNGEFTLVKNAKRKMDEDSNESNPKKHREESPIKTGANNHPGVAVIVSSSKGEKLTYMNPIKVNTDIVNFLTNGLVKIIPLPRGDLLLIVKNEIFANKMLMEYSTLLGHQVKVNRPKGDGQGRIIRERGIVDWVPTHISESDLQSALNYASLNIIKVLKNRGNEKYNPDYYSVVVVGETIPEKVYVGYITLRVKKSAPPPVRCAKCQRFGHAENVCRATCFTCPTCAGKHRYEDCKSQLKKCSNCGGQHSCAWRGCQSIKIEKKVIETQIKENVARKDATKIVHKAKQQSAVITTKGMPTAKPVEVPQPPSQTTQTAPRSVTAEENATVINKQDRVLTPKRVTPVPKVSNKPSYADKVVGDINMVVSEKNPVNDTEDCFMKAIFEILIMFTQGIHKTSEGKGAILAKLINFVTL